MVAHQTHFASALGLTPPWKVLDTNFSKAKNRKNNHLQGRFRYVKSTVPSVATALSYADGSPRRKLCKDA